MTVRPYCASRIWNRYDSVVETGGGDKRSISDYLLRRVAGLLVGTALLAVAYLADQLDRWAYARALGTVLAATSVAIGAFFLLTARRMTQVVLSAEARASALTSKKIDEAESRLRSALAKVESAL